MASSSSQGRTGSHSRLADAARVATLATATAAAAAGAYWAWFYRRRRQQSASSPDAEARCIDRAQNEPEGCDMFEKAVKNAFLEIRSRPLPDLRDPDVQEAILLGNEFTEIVPRLFLAGDYSPQKVAYLNGNIKNIAPKLGFVVRCSEKPSKCVEASDVPTFVFEPREDSEGRVCVGIHCFDHTAKNDLRKLRDCCIQIKAKLERQCNVLVHCQQGVDRSPTVVAAFCMAYFDISATDARESLKRLRPACTEQVPGYEELLRTNESKIRRFFDPMQDSNQVVVTEVAEPVADNASCKVVASVVEEEEEADDGGVIDILVRMTPSGVELTTLCLATSVTVLELRQLLEPTLERHVPLGAVRNISILVNGTIAEENSTLFRAGLRSGDAEVEVALVDRIGKLRECPCFAEEDGLPPQFQWSLAEPEVQECLEAFRESLGAETIRFAHGSRAFIVIVAPDLASGQLVVLVPCHLEPFDHPAPLLEILCYWGLFAKMDTNADVDALSEARRIASDAIGEVLPDWRRQVAFSCALLGTFNFVAEVPIWFPMDANLVVHQKEMVLFQEKPMVKVRLPPPGGPPGATMLEEDMRTYEKALNQPSVQNMLLTLLALLPHSETWVGVTRELIIAPADAPSLGMAPPIYMRQQLPPQLAGMRIVHDPPFFIAVPRKKDHKDAYESPRALLELLWFITATKLSLLPEQPLKIEDGDTLWSTVPQNLGIIGDRAVHWFEEKLCPTTSLLGDLIPGDNRRYWLSKVGDVVAGTTLLAQRDVTIYESVESAEDTAVLRAGKRVIASGCPQIEEGYILVPIEPCGAVELSAFRVVEESELREERAQQQQYAAISTDARPDAPNRKPRPDAPNRRPDAPNRRPDAPNRKPPPNRTA